MKKIARSIKTFFTRETFRITVFVFAVMFILKLIIFNIHLFDTFAESLRDFDFTDLVYLKEKKPDRMIHPNTDIVLVNLDSSREGTARQIEILEKENPKVLAIDSWYPDFKDKKGDSLLSATIKKYSNIILGGSIGIEKNEAKADTLYVTSDPFFSGRSANGFVDFMAMDTDNTVRYFSPGEMVKGHFIYAFSSRIIKTFNPEKYDALRERGQSREYIYYRYLPTDFVMRFDTREITDNNPDLKKIKEKIVIMGQLGYNKKITLADDLNFTPLNKKLGGRSFPDMYGVYIHANIVAMILEEKYVDEFSHWLTWIFSFLFCYLHIYLFVKVSVHKPMWFHIYTKLMQLFSGAVIVGVALLLLSGCRLKLEVDCIIVPVLLAVDAIYLYEGMIKVINKKFPVRSDFLKAHH